jgi:Rieske Fe-S protein
MSDSDDGKEPKISRRGVLRGASSAAMLGGLAAGYGAFGAIAVRYLYPARPPQTAWLYVTDIERLKAGESLTFRTPSGARAAIARQGESGAVSDFIALSSTCPHLGCQVHWEAAANRFFCPCHNGAFDPSGKAIAGPPAEAKQSLPRYPLKIEGALLFIEVPVEEVARGAGEVETIQVANLPPGSKPGRS